MSSSFSLAIRRVALCLLIASLGLGPAVAGLAQSKKAASGASLTPVAWLAGKWRLEKNGRVVDEQWMAPAGGVMLGMSRTLLRGRATEQEFLQLREGPGGDLFLIIQPTGAKPATFKSLKATAGEIVFTNQLQDFPQTIVYALRSDGTLAVTKEGPGDDGQVRKIETVYQRTGP